MSVLFASGRSSWEARGGGGGEVTASRCSDVAGVGLVWVWAGPVSPRQARGSVRVVFFTFLYGVVLVWSEEVAALCCSLQGGVRYCGRSELGVVWIDGGLDGCIWCVLGAEISMLGDEICDGFVPRGRIDDCI